jgi:hypothetical protein
MRIQNIDKDEQFKLDYDSVVSKALLTTLLLVTPYDDLCGILAKLV